MSLIHWKIILTSRERGMRIHSCRKDLKPRKTCIDRFVELQEKAYTMNDLIGKSGVEASYEEALERLLRKTYLRDRYQRQLLARAAGVSGIAPGKKITLTISAELQDFAEKLLSSIEGSRPEDGNWTRPGCGAEPSWRWFRRRERVVALASYPRFDPNDFIPTRDLDA
jgi:cell division protein FtsI/penicillin-binding protein 2